MTEFPFLPYRVIEKYLDEAKAKKVSEKARSKGQFLDVYKKHGALLLPEEWKTKRENFIKRHLVQYKSNPTERRRLALIVWAFDPEKK